MFTASRIESESREVNPLSGKRVDVDARPLRNANLRARRQTSRSKGIDRISRA
jgi:hypothetical protein